MQPDGRFGRGRNQHLEIMVPLRLSVREAITMGNFLKFERRGRRKKKPKVEWRLAFIVLLSTFVLGMIALQLIPRGDAGTDAPQSLLSVDNDPEQPSLALCGSAFRRNCVVDGDTIWLNGTKIRIADIDTPEVSEPRCGAERQLGMEAPYRLRELLNEGPFSVSPIGARDEDQYGRKLRVLNRNGQSIGDMLVAEGLARTWTGRREPWC